MNPEIKEVIGEFNFGSFEYESLIIKIDSSADQMLDAFQSADKKQAVQDMIKLLKKAMLATAPSHELRHFVDTFGTIAGLSLFSEHIRLLTMFAEACQKASSEFGPDWIFSATSLVPSAPPYLKTALNRLVGFHSVTGYFRTPFEPYEVSEEIAKPYVQVPVEFKVPRFGHGGMISDYTVAGFSHLTATIDSKTLKPKKENLILYPIGYEALVEGNANAIQRDGIIRQYGVELDHFFKQFPYLPIKGRRFGKGDVSLSVRPYMITDLLLTKIMRSHDVPTFDIESLLVLTDIVLSQSEICHLDGVGFSANSPGDTFVNVADENWREIRDGTLKHPVECLERYQEKLDRIEALPNHDSIDDTGVVSDLHAFHAFVMKEIAHPLLSKRIQTDHQAFTTIKGFNEVIGSMSSFPCVLVQNSGITVPSTMSERIRQAWVNTIMLGDIVRQLLSIEGLLLCPRRHNRITGFNFLNMVPTGDCNREIKLGCGNHYEDRALNLPSCMFSFLLQKLGLLT